VLRKDLIILKIYGRMLKVKSIRPVYTRLITTANRYTESQKVGSILDANKLEGRYKEYQTVVKVGSSVREVKEGDVVLIDPSRYMKRKYNDNSLREDFVDNPIVEINIPTVTMNDTDYFMIEERDIVYIIEDSEEIPDSNPNNLILPKEKKIITN
jgi:co-chaperonin GroES (HSP10)